MHHTHTHTHLHTHSYTLVQTLTPIHTLTHIYIHTHLYTYTHTHTHTHTHSRWGQKRCLDFKIHSEAAHFSICVCELLILIKKDQDSGFGFFLFFFVFFLFFFFCCFFFVSLGQFFSYFGQRALFAPWVSPHLWLSLPCLLYCIWWHKRLLRTDLDPSLLSLMSVAGIVRMFSPVTAESFHFHFSLCLFMTHLEYTVMHDMKNMGGSWS